MITTAMPLRGATQVECSSGGPGKTSLAAGIAARAIAAADGSPLTGVLGAFQKLRAYRAPEHVTRTHQREMDRLTSLRLCARSQGLACAIHEAMPVKVATFQAGQAHGRAETLLSYLPDNTPHVILEAVRAVEAEMDMGFQEGLRRLDVAAAAVAQAPVGGLSDIMDRADAFVQVLGNADSDGLPETVEDVAILHGSYRAAIEDLYDRGRVGDDDTFAEGECRLRKVEGRLTYLNRLWDEKWGSVALVPKGADPDLKKQIDAAYAERDAARTLMYAGTPRDVGELLALMEIAFDHVGGVDVTSYEVRDRVIGTEPVEERDMWLDERQSHRRALALIARHAARLRDQTMPKDWRDLMETMARTPNGRDAVWRAYDKGMDAANLKNIQLTGRPADQLPVLMFEQRDGTYWIGPDAAFKGEAAQ